jgi:hypothetical protein
MSDEGSDSWLRIAKVCGKARERMPQYIMPQGESWLYAIKSATAKVYAYQRHMLLQHRAPETTNDRHPLFSSRVLCLGA